MTHKWEIRHLANGEFWIFNYQVMQGEAYWGKFIGPFMNLLAAESGIARLIDEPTWKYDEDGRLVE